jgi:hypothetical protein
MCISQLLATALLHNKRPHSSMAYCSKHLFLPPVLQTSQGSTASFSWVDLAKLTPGHKFG